MAGAMGTRRLVGLMPRPKCARFATTTYPSPPIKLFTAWFCPFAQRCAIALEHHSVPYVPEEALGWTVRPTTVGEEGRTEEAAYHWKSPALIAANPSGMVPTLLDEATGRVAKESLVTVEFVDDYARAHGSTAASLMPSEPFGRADARVMSNWVNAKACSPYYSVLCKQDPAEQRAAFDGLVGALREFGARLEKRGAFFCGESLSLVDIALLPWANRYYVFEHYRGAAFAIPTDGTLAAYHEWLSRCNRLAAVSGTTPDKDRYLEHIKKYATNTARSKVANAVRRGVAAHEYDDAKD